MMILLSNIVWPSMILTGRIVAVIPILAGLVVEFLYLRYGTTLRGVRCLWADLSMNLVSALLGLILIPLSGIGWELLASMTIYPLLNIGSFNPVTWTASVILAAIMNAVVEGFVLRSGFGLVLGRRGFWLLATVNLVTVSIAAVSVIIDPPKF
ncbi:MAG: hypothetical protein HS117_24610 [Verrucomicrobiaceae bacterium]|nr:hypothetical protein [Verrucomicrobiaceae bacterium]